MNESIDSIQTSMAIGLFNTKQQSITAHKKAKRVLFPLEYSNNFLDNFKSVRLSSVPYPTQDRQRGQADLDSVEFHRRKLRETGTTEPIWIAQKGNLHILLDGAHRLAAAARENVKQLPAYIVIVKV
jgi:hypothetical protein